jgi:hypothetical protein
MMTKYKAVPGAMLAVLTATFFASAPHSYGQGTIQMANVTANVDKTIDSKKAKAGDAFSAKTTSGTTLNDGTNIPAGSELVGQVVSAVPSEHKSDGSLVVTIDKVQIKGGKEIAVKAVIASVESFEAAFGGSGQTQDRAFDANARDSARMNGASDAQNAPTGPHPVAGLTVTGAVTDPTSGTFTQAKGNVHLSNENQLQVSIAVVPAGVKIQ